jgi:lipid-A-disaccharide synthase
MRAFLVAAEASGDALGADLIRALREREPAVEIAGVGAAAMAHEGVRSAIDVSGLSVFGLVDGLKIYARVLRAVQATADAAIAFNPDLVVLIDSWGFTLRVAQRLRVLRPDIRLVKYIGPQVWAARAGRAKTLARLVDHLICIHDFEVPYYAPLGLACTVCGHPAIGRARAGDGAAFRARHGLDPDELLLLVLPGSRRAEIRRVGPFLWDAAGLLRERFPRLRVAAVAAQPVAESVRAQAIADALIVGEEEKEDAFAAASVALAASGTVTTEIALQGAPMIVAYKLGWITWALARFLLFKARYVTLLNVAADREVVPEFLQTRLTARNLAAAAGRLVADPQARQAQVAAQNGALAKMGRGGRPAAEIAAEAVLKVAQRGK